MSYQYEPFNYGQVSVTSSPTQIVGINRARQAVKSSITAQPTFISEMSNVTTSTGLLLVGTKGASLTISTTNAVYGVVSSSEEVVSYLEVQK